jgi:hypothetical protein
MAGNSNLGRQNQCSDSERKIRPISVKIDQKSVQYNVSTRVQLSPDHPESVDQGESHGLYSLTFSNRISEREGQ